MSPFYLVPTAEEIRNLTRRAVSDLDVRREPRDRRLRLLSDAIVGAAARGRHVVTVPIWLDWPQSPVWPVGIRGQFDDEMAAVIEHLCAAGYQATVDEWPSDMVPHRSVRLTVTW